MVYQCPQGRVAQLLIHREAMEEMEGIPLRVPLDTQREEIFLTGEALCP